MVFVIQKGSPVRTDGAPFHLFERRSEDIEGDNITDGHIPLHIGDDTAVLIAVHVCGDPFNHKGHTGGTHIGPRAVGGGAAPPCFP